MVEVLDYSAGWPSPRAVLDARYVGAVRYIGTPGRGKNLTRAEAQAMLAAGVPLALVYETTAGWALGGTQAGSDAARAALADAAACGVQVRCLYLACDVDVTDAQQMQALQRTLDGAANVLGIGRTGVYGEADVIDACVPTHAAWGWQTRAWSGGRVSTKAHLLQQIGYVSVGGVQCDRNTVLKTDWGQWPSPDPTPAPQPKPIGADMIYIEVPGRPGRILVPGFAAGVPSGAVRDAFKAAATGQPITVAQYDLLVDYIENTSPEQNWATERHDTNAATLREVLQQWPALRAQLNALSAAVAGLSTTDPTALAAALAPLLPHVDQQTVEAALRAVLGGLDNTPAA